MDTDLLINVHGTEEEFGLQVFSTSSLEKQNRSGNGKIDVYTWVVHLRYNSKSEENNKK